MRGCSSNEQQNDLRVAALAYWAAGLSLVPASHKTKKPTCEWKTYQEEIVDDATLKSWLTNDIRSIAVVGGAVSGSLLVIDFDVARFFDLWMVEVGELADGLPVQRTGGGGYQVFLRCPNPGRNDKLAWEKDDAEDTGRTIAIETRAEGGYVLVPPSLHPSGNRYEMITGDLTAIPTISQARADALLLAARKLDEASNTRQQMEQQARPSEKYRQGVNDHVSVIDTFNAASPIEQTLERFGYVPSGDRFRRPGGENPSVVVRDGQSFHHSTNDPLCDGYWHNAFDLFCYYRHGGDAKAAVKEAAEVLGISGNHNGAEMKDGDKQDEPINLPQEPKVECLPLEALPGLLARFVTEVSAALPCPPDFVGVPMLAVLGMAIGTSRVIQVKPGWTEGARFYAAVVADPGSRKSPALDWVVMPLRERQRELQGEYEEKKEAYQQKVSQFEVDLEAWKTATRNAARGEGSPPGEKPKEPDEPFMEQALTTDATLEALAVLLQQNPRGLIFLRDELTGWVHGMNQYKGGKGADRQAWLSFWNGAQVVVNRKSAKGPVLLDHPFVSVVGCLPPDVLGDLADERGREDGFIHRLLFAYPEHLPPFWTDAVVSQEAQDGYRKVFKELLRLSPGVDEAGQPAPVVVTFTAEGKETFIEWINSHHKELMDPLFPENLRGPWAKMEGYCARLALILQLVRYVSGEAKSKSVDTLSVEGAAALMDYFKSHARKVYSRLHVTKEVKQMELTLAWIRKQGGKTTLREMVTYKVAGVRAKSEAENLLGNLVDRGYGTIEKGAHGKVTFSFTT